MTFVSRLTGLLLIIAFLAACNSGEKAVEDKHVFLLDSLTGASLVVEDVIKQSGINKKGYVVIIPDKSGSAVGEAKMLKGEFYKKGVMAVHILNIDPTADLLRTDVITIENATIICLPSGSKLHLTEGGQYGLLLLNALKNGACFVVNDKETGQVLANETKP